MISSNRQPPSQSFVICSKNVSYWQEQMDLPRDRPICPASELRHSQTSTLLPHPLSTLAPTAPRTLLVIRSVPSIPIMHSHSRQQHHHIISTSTPLVLRPVLFLLLQLLQALRCRGTLSPVTQQPAQPLKPLTQVARAMIARMWAVAAATRALRRGLCPRCRRLSPSWKHSLCSSCSDC